MTNAETTTTPPVPFAEWAVVEIMGHVKIAGYATEAAIAGGKFLRVDVPAIKDQPAFSRYYGAASIYCISPTTEEIARGLSERLTSQPVQRYELPPRSEQGEAFDY